MARWGSCDYRQLQKLRDDLDKLRSADLEAFCRDVSRELAARLLALVIPRTPVGQYPRGSGKTGGALRRGWTAGTGGAAGYAASLPVEKAGSEYRVEVINPVEYAGMVEFGHHTRGGKSWVNGQYFLTLSERDLQSLAPGLIEKKLNALLQEVFAHV